MDWLNIGNRAGRHFKQYRYVILILLVGIFLMLIPDDTAYPPDTDDHLSEPAPLEVSLQESLESLLCQIEGAGKVKVLLTMAAGERTIYQFDEDESHTDGSSNIRTETVVLTDGSRGEYGLVQQILPPVYQGAIILCQGANSPAIRLSIVEATADATGLTSDNITVLKMK